MVVTVTAVSLTRIAVWNVAADGEYIAKLAAGQSPLDDDGDGLPDDGQPNLESLILMQMLTMTVLQTEMSSLSELIQQTLTLTVTELLMVTKSQADLILLMTRASHYLLQSLTTTLRAIPIPWLLTVHLTETMPL